MATSVTPQPGQGSGGTTNNNAPSGGQGSPTASYVVTTAAVPAQQARSDEEGQSPRARKAEGARNIADRMVERFGTVDAAITGLAGELYDLREERREDRERLRQLPPAGAVVLVGDDIGAWNAYKQLGLAPDKVKERIALADTLERERHTAQTGTLAEQAATALGWGGKTVLGELVTDKGLTLEMRDAAVPDGKGGQVIRKMPFTRKASDPNAVWTPLADYVTQNHAGYLPALTTAPATPQGGTPGTSTGTPAPGTAGITPPVTPQGGAPPAVVMGTGTATPAAPGTSQPTNPVDRLLAANHAAANAGNALRPKPQG